MELKLIDFLLRYRYLLAIASLVLTALIASGAKNLYFESDYKIFFKANDPHRLANEEIEDTFTRSDNLTILLRPADGDLFTERNLRIIHEITELAWQAPYISRVDSLTNFQHTSADGDDLLVADLLYDPEDLNPSVIAKIKNIGLTEKSLASRLVSADGETTLINLTLELPPTPDPDADRETQIEQRATQEASLPEILVFGRQLVADYQQRYPDLEMHLGGITVINNSFNEMSMKDMSLLVPLMYLIIIVVLAVFLRSIGSVVGALLVIGCATLTGFGAAGWLGYAINSVNVVAPTIILTIAVCDAVHLLIIYLRGLSLELTPVEAMRDSLRLNLQPIILTSLTTVVGFLTLNLSPSPPFAELGTMASAGVLWAMLLTFTLLPPVTMILVRKRNPGQTTNKLLDRYARFVVLYRKPVFIGSLLAAFALMAFIPLNVIDDDPISYFKHGVPYRDASEFTIESGLGVNDVNFSIDCGTPGCINKVTYLVKLDKFDKWLHQQPAVIHVSSYADVLKRLNKSMHRDDDAFYRIPESTELSAQYNLLYEMSLSYGLDLNNQINMDKSSTKVMVMAEQMTSDELISLGADASQWLKQNYSEQSAPGASIILMFAHMGMQNIRSLLVGGLFAIIGVTLTIFIALRSMRYALISMIPNSLPALMALGVWGLTVAQVNMGVAAVFSISLGILVDDTVHFISKYRRAREVRGLSPEESIYYAFSNVGTALIVTTIVLVAGFGLLGISDFNLNSMMGTITAITIAIALAFDFLILPPVLIFFDKDRRQQQKLLV